MSRPFVFTRHTYNVPTHETLVVDAEALLANGWTIRTDYDEPSYGGTVLFAGSGAKIELHFVDEDEEISKSDEPWLDIRRRLAEAGDFEMDDEWRRLMHFVGIFKDDEA